MAITKAGMDFPGVNRIRDHSLGGAWESSVPDRVSSKMIKAELLQMADEQEKAWMTMRYTVEELERRLRIVEIEKAQFEDILQLRMISRTLGAAEEDSDTSLADRQDSLIDYSSFYVSKIFDNRQVGNDGGKPPSGKRLQRQLTSFSEVAEEQEDLCWQMEAQRLRVEVCRLEEELRLATQQQQVSVDVLDDAPEEMSDAASSSPASHISTITLESEDGDVRPMSRTRGEHPDGGETASFSGQLSDSFLMQASRLEGLHRSFKKRGVGKTGMQTAEDSVIGLLTQLSRELGGVCRSLQTEFLSAGHMPPWVASLENALAGLKGNETMAGGKRIQAKDISELEEKLKAQGYQFTQVLEKHSKELQRKDNTVKYAQEINMQLATDLTRLEAELADVRSKNKGLQASMEVRFKEARNTSVTAIQSELAKSETRILELESMLAERDSQLQEVRRRMHSAQSETDAIAIEKIDLFQKLRDLRKEADGHRERVKGLVAINKEALQFAESKEEEATRLRLHFTGYDQTLQERSDACSRMTEELKEAKKQLRVAEEENKRERLEHNAVKEKVKEMDYEMRQREDALERLTKHLASLVRDNDSLHSSSLRFQHGVRGNSKEKDSKAFEQYRQSKVIIRDLEEKLGSMEKLESEFSKVRIQMAEMKVDDRLVPQKST